MPRSPEPQLAARPDPPAGDAPSSASEASDDDEDAYEVEAIRASRFDEYAGAMRYFIKWKGYGENEKTWEPIENLQNCLGLVKEFERHQAEIKRKLAERQAEASADKRDKSLTKKAAARPSSSNDAPEGDGVSLKELDARREKAKKARASDIRLQAGRVESSVAEKWEKKGKKKARSSEPVASTSKARDATRPPAKKREADDKPASSPAKKRKTPKVAVESDESSEDDAAPSKRPRPAATSAPAKTAATAPNGTTASATAATKPVNGARPTAGSASPAATGPEAQPVASTSTPTTEPRASAEPAPTKPQPRRPAPGKQGPWETISSLMGKSFKKAPPPPAPAPAAATASAAEHARSPHLDSPVDGPAHNSRVRFASEPEGPAAPRPAAAAQPAHSALRPGPAQPAARRASPAAAAAQPAVLAAGPGVAPPMPDGPAGGDSPLEEGEERAAADAPDTVRQMEMQRLKRLADMEARLRRTAWCRNDARFELEALPVACAEAIPIDTTLGVAVLFSSGEDARGGEGIALGYLLMAMRAITPDRLEAVEAVFLHRHDSFAQIEGLYAELVNLEHHAVEFFRFGGGEPVESIFGSGYLVVPTLSALQRGASYDRFCSTVRDVYARTCQMYAHPATVAYLRTLPNWFSIVDRLNATAVDIIAREELPLTSAFASVDKSTLLQPAATWPPSIPQVDASIELNETITHIVHTRFKYASTWRRFIIVVDELRNEDVDLARKRGIELAPWESLSDLVKAHPFG
ncbi:hypothetical protein JCM10450v2_004148 [Rhodotorula kratochvilovae]